MVLICLSWLVVGWSKITGRGCACLFIKKVLNSSLELLFLTILKSLPHYHTTTTTTIMAVKLAYCSKGSRLKQNSDIKLHCEGLCVKLPLDRFNKVNVGTFHFTAVCLLPSVSRSFCIVIINPSTSRIFHIATHCSCHAHYYVLGTGSKDLCFQ